jgi:general secretion pathway protein F
MTNADPQWGPDGVPRTAGRATVPERRGRPPSVDDFFVLNEEIRAFVRAGIPLEVGLRGTASQTEGALSGIASRISQRIEQGRTLEQAITDEGTAVPAEYRALLAAGLRTGRLADVLTSISDLGRSLSRLRQQLRLAAIYPAIVFVIAYGLLIGLMLFVVPTLRRAQTIFRTEESPFFRVLARLSETVGLWGISLPLALIALWLLSRVFRRTRGIGDSGVDGLGWLPGARDVCLARFARVLSLLTRYSVPLPEALRLSGDASGSERLRRVAADLAERIEAGQTLRASLPAAARLPAFLRWLMQVGEHQGTLPDSLDQAASVYEQRALARLNWFRRVVPPAIVLVLGGVITLTYALSVFVPMTQLLESLQEVPR